MAPFSKEFCMTSYKTPSVYIQDKQNIHRAIEAVSTSTTCFLGQTAKGSLNEYTPIDSIIEFESKFGSQNTPLGIAVQQFFINGGSKAVICRVGNIINQEELEGEFNPEKIQIEAPIARDYLTQIEALKHSKTLQDVAINILIFPEITWNSEDEKHIIRTAIEYSEQSKNCMVIFDLPIDVNLSSLKQITQLQLPNSAYAAVYHPYLTIKNPNQSASDTTSTEPSTINIPNSASMAGLWAKTDAYRGVWKAPAGADSKLNHLTDLQLDISELQQALLNPVGINCIRKGSNYDHVVWGARTLLSELDSELHYIPVRRTLNMIETSLVKGLSWAVFEPNTENLWNNIKS
ncbi:MAG TPA: phage tail sheath family protein, partial [Thiomicrospira sp.]|nr:phage tail sheath family protein [Thiomicrospira sp.]